MNLHREWGKCENHDFMVFDQLQTRICQKQVCQFKLVHPVYHFFQIEKSEKCQKHDEIFS